MEQLVQLKLGRMARAAAAAAWMKSRGEGADVCVQGPSQLDF